MNSVLLLHLLTAIICVLIVAVFFSLYWSVFGPDGKLRRWLCRRMHGEPAMFAGGRNFTCWCGLVFRTPWAKKKTDNVVTMNRPGWAILWKLPHKVIGGDCHELKGPLMVRFYLLRTKLVVIAVHCFLRSDLDRAFHDHPWNFLSLLLSNYREHTPKGIFNRRRFSVLYRPATWQHWIEIAPGKRAWSVVIMSKRVREWGFITPKGWVHWRQFDADQNCG